MASPSALRSTGVYRVPYKNGTTVRVSNDEGSHFPPNRYDLVGTAGNGMYEVVAAAAGTVRTGDGELAGPLIRLEPAGSLSFGQVLLGRSATREVRLVNPSSDDPVTLNIDAASSGPIRWSAVSATIAPEGNRTVPITFRPTRLGRVPATMSIAVTAPTAHVVRLSIDGTGAGGPHVP